VLESTKKGLLRVTFHMFRYELISKQFVLSAVLILLVLFIYKPLVQETPLDTFLVPVQWNSASYLMVLAGGFCSASSFSRDLSSRFYYFEVVACGKLRYLLARFVSCSFATGVAFFLGVILYAAYVYSLPESSYLAEMSALDYGTFNDSMLVGGDILIIFLFSYIQFLTGSLVGSLGITSTAFVPNKYVGYIAAFVVLFLWSQIALHLHWPIWANPLVLSMSLYDLGGTQSALLVSSACFFISNFLLCLVFVLKAKRVLDND
jgi:hypothetical protein